MGVVPIGEVVLGGDGFGEAVFGDRLGLVGVEQVDGGKDPDIGVPEDVAVVLLIAQAEGADREGSVGGDRGLEVEEEGSDGLLVFDGAVDFDVGLPSSSTLWCRRLRRRRR